MRYTNDLFIVRMDSHCPPYDKSQVTTTLKSKDDKNTKKGRYTITLGNHNEMEKTTMNIGHRLIHGCSQTEEQGRTCCLSSLKRFVIPAGFSSTH